MYHALFVLCSVWHSWIFFSSTFSLSCDEEQPWNGIERGRERGRGRGTERARGRVGGRERERGRGRGQSDGSGDAADRSRSPHGTRWKSLGEPDDGVPKPLKFCLRRTPGVQPPLNVGNPPPGEIFGHFFDDEVFQLLCENTNKNAEKNLLRGSKFPLDGNTSRGNEKNPWHIIVYVSCEAAKNLRLLAQGNNFPHPIPSNHHGQRRFEAILSNVHMSDPAEDQINEEKKGTEEYDCLHRVRPLMEMICARCKVYYHPRRHLAVDERMVATKARLKISQYIKAKPTKWGLKFFMLAASWSTSPSTQASPACHQARGSHLMLWLHWWRKNIKIWVHCLYRQFLHKSSPLHTPEPAGVQSLWDLQAGKSRSPHHTRECPH